MKFLIGIFSGRLKDIEDKPAQIRGIYRSLNLGAFPTKQENRSSY